MGRYILGRILQLLPVLWLISLIVFMIMHVLPGDPAELMLAGAEGGAITPERLQELHREMGLDDPLVVQYARFVLNALVGDLGTSIRFRLPVTELIWDRFAATLELSIAGLLCALAIASRSAWSRRCARTASSTRPRWGSPMSARRCRSTGSASSSSSCSPSSSAGSRPQGPMTGAASSCPPRRSGSSPRA